MGTVQRSIGVLRMIRVARSRLGRTYIGGPRRRPSWLLLLAVGLAAVPAAGAAATTPVGLFLDQTNKVNSASLVRDAAGGLHVAFAAYGQEANGQEPAHYAFCPSDCGTRANWSVIAIGDGQSHVSEVQLALTSDGRPRLLIRGTDVSFMTQYQYAACEAGCTSAVSWGLTTIRKISYVDPTIFDYSQHYFALDHLGRPRFIYYDNDGTIHLGSFYAFCNAGCTSAANWSELLLTTDLFELPSLTFTSSGQPRLATVIFGSTPQSGNLAYLECDTDCETNPTNWQGTFLLPRGSGHSTWVLRLDSQNRSRIAFYQADVGNGQGNALGYLWCDTGCRNGAGWDVATLDLTPAIGTDDADADLVFDGQDRPHLSYRTGAPDFGLAHARCDANCQSGSGSWHGELLESSNRLNTERPLPPAPGCTQTSWFGGFRSSLALDAAGNPLVAYDAEHIVNVGSTCTATETDFKTIRVVVLVTPLPQPTVSLTASPGTVSAGVPLQVQGTVANSGPEGEVDVFLAAMLPPAAGPGLGCPGQDAVAFVTESGGFALACLSSPPATFPRFARRVVLPAGFGPVTVPLLSLSWPPGLLPGTYGFVLAFTRLDAFSDGMQPTDILALGTAAVVQSP